MTEPLNPCLICGDPAEIGSASDALDRVWFMVQCPNGCRGNHTTYEDEESAIAEWNNWNPRRIELPRLREEYQRALDTENKRTGRESETTTLGVTRTQHRLLGIKIAEHLFDHFADVVHQGIEKLRNLDREIAEGRQ